MFLGWASARSIHVQPTRITHRSAVGSADAALVNDTAQSWDGQQAAAAVSPLAGGWRP